MVYLILGVGIAYSLYWLLIYFFSLRSRRERLPIIFVALALILSHAFGYGFYKALMWGGELSFLQIISFGNISVDLGPAVKIFVMSMIVLLLPLVSWIASLMRTEREKWNVFYPAMFMSLFATVNWFGFETYMDAQNYPDRLTPEMYSKIELGMSPSQVEEIVRLNPIDMENLSSQSKSRYSFSGNNIQMPPAIRARLGSSSYDAPRKESFLTFSVSGEMAKKLLKKAPKPQEKPKAENKEKAKELENEPDTYDTVLVHPATKNMNGLVGLKVRFFTEDLEAAKKAREEHKALTEEIKQKFQTKKEVAENLPHLIIPGGNEVSVEEGKDWNYTADMNPANVASKLCTVIAGKRDDFVCKYTYAEEEKKCSDLCAANDPSISYYKTQADELCKAKKKAPKDCVQTTCTEECMRLEGEAFDDRFEIHISPDSKDFIGENGNKWGAQVDTGSNNAFLIRNNPNGVRVQFRGGDDAATLRYWEEQDVILDDDFDTNRRLLIAGFINDKLIAVGQNGMILTPEQEKKLAYQP